MLHPIQPFLLLILSDLLSVEYIEFISQAYFCGKPKWTVNDIPDLSGQVMIVTGGNSGIGKETAKALLDRGAKVYIACRDQQKAEATIIELESLTGRTALFLKLDLADLNAVAAAARKFLSKEAKLHVLFNNGGILSPMDQVSSGYDRQIYTNVLGHFYFTKLLLPLLIASAKNTPDGKVRVVNTSSSGHYLAKHRPINTASFKVGFVRDSYSSTDMYVQSKFANVIFARELARRYADQGIVSTAVNPGNTRTALDRYTPTGFKKLALVLLQIYPSAWGALPQLWAGTSPEAADINGKFVIPWAGVGKPRIETGDPELGKELWAWLEDQSDTPHECTHIATPGVSPTAYDWALASGGVVRRQ
ncbi:NAD(P)-binding protein [Infundibulicybe gibba]|nr:NAD(P)-binding protein [Infundibulicybe gibba]